MAYLNANIPVTYAQIRREYLYDLKKHHGEVEDCIIFGITSITGRAILWHAVMENGAVFYRLPISAFIQRGFKQEEVPKRRLDELELWNCFSYYPAVCSWDIIQGTSGKYIGKDKKWHHGRYLFTVDFAHPESNILDTEHSEIPHEHNCAHILALDDGNYAAQPNNRLIQGSAADMTKKAMIELYKEGITPHIQVHDELDISVSDNADKIKEIMEHTVELEVPNKVDYEHGNNWGSIK